MADISKRTVIITGANCGIGFGAAQKLAEKNYRVILGCRSEERAQAAVKLIKDANPDVDVTYHLLDLGDLSSVKEFAEWFLSTGHTLHALVNNAGIVPSDTRGTTKDGFEMTFGVNHLGHFLLTLLLLDKLKSTAAQVGEARIVTVASGMHNFQKEPGLARMNLKPIDFDDLNLEKPNAYNGWQAYKNSKAANVLFTKALSRLMSGSGVVANTMCPGLIPSTQIFRNASFLSKCFMYVIDNFLTRRLFKVRTIDYGAQHIVDLVDDVKFKDVSGVYYKDFDVVEASEEARNVDNQNQLWMKSCELVGRQDYESLLK